MTPARHKEILACFGFRSHRQGLEAIHADRLVLERHGLVHPLQQDFPVSRRHLRRGIVLAAPLFESRVGLSEINRRVRFLIHGRYSPSVSGEMQMRPLQTRPGNEKPSGRSLCSCSARSKKRMARRLVWSLCSSDARSGDHASRLAECVLRIEFIRDSTFMNREQRDLVNGAD